MDSIGVGLIGTGYMGKCHATAWGGVKARFASVIRPRLEVLCDANEDVARDCASAFGFLSSTTDWRDLINNPAIDVISITTPNGLHPEIAIAALEAGKHVWCEKPMGLTLGHAADMTKAAEKAALSGVKSQLGYNYVHNPAILHAKKLIDDGAIGRIIHFRGQVDEDYMADPQLPWTWRCKIENGGLGTLGDLTCHLISLAHFLIGDIARVLADQDTVHKERPLPGGKTGETGTVENEDMAQAIIRFGNGTSGLVSSSRVAWGRKSMIRMEIHGDKGMIVFDQERMNELELFQATGDKATRGFTRILTGPEHSPYREFCPAAGHQLGFNELKIIEAAQLLDSIAGKGSNWPDFAAGQKIERVIHGIAISATKGQWVETS
ncbi:Gfo/Idh/MocA family oxidoreductase [Kiloniella laminariae]|uniref:Gfo/Idh/MocA family oxidoreductase n=1 Tax=Kiloniella laminariae TaxID=454162 RepID=A0ABT4LGH2_9PROT|nr:Gfo/Idh/MocA family oxidoreductase [Kiloniella laminariae]MCZ4280204.1 Gfo/Idh/MocA family oxidoreductase [Kiloniella laminariae]